MVEIVSVSDAKAHLSSLVDRAAAGEEIVIAKNGVPSARLVAAARQGAARRPANAMRVSYIAEDFDAPDAAVNTLLGTSNE
jgi:prevent-host-death family protein